MELHTLLSARPQNCSISNWFEKIAQCLLNKVSLVINGENYRFIEVEFYYQNDSDHNDPCVHGDPLQKTCHLWYFHRSGGTYRSGTFKGLDITFAEKDVFGGIIIRGIENENGEVIDGPCLCVNHMLAKTNKSHVRELDNLVTPYDIWNAKSPLFIREHESLPQRNIIDCPRVGLTLRYRNKAQQMSNYIMKNYRYLSAPRKTKKGKVYSALSLHTKGKTSEEIQAITASTKKAIGNYIGFFQEGQKCNDFSTYIGKKLDAQSIARLYGTWWNVYGDESQ
ncbi:hypothetical protein [Candidatus Uabimicrobium sp. HlEnr_7]|uniref:hypothetical protein n=1 Tax=Candidatus Uabimicrobium helgolandensis TaxID=3095367 RepID=UPI003555CCF2